MTDYNDNGISGENEELISRIAGLIRKEKNRQAIEVMVGEKIAETDFGSIPLEEEKIHRFSGWQKYAAIAAVLVIGGVIGIRMLEENRSVTKKNGDIALNPQSENSKSNNEAPLPPPPDTSGVLAETEAFAAEEAVPGEQAAPEPTKPIEDAPVAMLEKQATPRDRGTGEYKVNRSTVESAKEQNLGGAFAINERTNRSMQAPSVQPGTEMKPGMPSPKIYGNIQDTIGKFNDLAVTDKKMGTDDDEETSRNVTRSLKKDESISSSKKEISQFLISPGVLNINTEKIKREVINVLQSYGFQNLNISEKEYYVQINTEPSEGFSSKLGKNINYFIEVKINKSQLGGISVKLLNLLEEGRKLMNKSIVPIEDLFNKSIKNSLNKALGK